MSCNCSNIFSLYGEDSSNTERWKRSTLQWKVHNENFSLSLANNYNLNSVVQMTDEARRRKRKVELIFFPALQNCLNLNVYDGAQRGRQFKTSFFSHEFQLQMKINTFNLRTEKRRKKENAKVNIRELRKWNEIVQFFYELRLLLRRASDDDSKSSP